MNVLDGVEAYFSTWTRRNRKRREHKVGQLSAVIVTKSQWRRLTCSTAYSREIKVSFPPPDSSHPGRLRTRMLNSIDDASNGKNSATEITQLREDGKRVSQTLAHPWKTRWRETRTHSIGHSASVLRLKWRNWKPLLSTSSRPSDLATSVGNDSTLGTLNRSMITSTSPLRLKRVLPPLWLACLSMAHPDPGDEDEGTLTSSTVAETDEVRVA